MHVSAGFHFYVVHIILSRSMKILERWKMREIHVFFMYFAYHIYNKVATNLAKSEELLDACRHLLVALHLVKGFSSKVCASRLLICYLILIQFRVIACILQNNRFLTTLFWDFSENWPRHSETCPVPHWQVLGNLRKGVFTLTHDVQNALTPSYAWRCCISQMPLGIPLLLPIWKLPWKVERVFAQWTTATVPNQVRSEVLF